MNGSTQIFFTLASDVANQQGTNASGKSSSDNSTSDKLSSNHQAKMRGTIEGSPSLFITAASLPPHKETGINAIYRCDKKIGQRVIQEEPTPELVRNSTPIGTQPTHDGKDGKDGKKAEIKTDKVTLSLADMNDELKAHAKRLPEHWFDQEFRDHALTRFMRHANNVAIDNTTGRRVDSGSCLERADKLLSMGAVANDEVQEIINNLIEQYLLQDRFGDAIRYEHIWAAANSSLKEKQVDKLLYSINKQQFNYSRCSSLHLKNEVFRLRSILMTPGINMTPGRQRLLNMAYLKVKHDGYDELTKSLRELGGRDDGEALYDKLVTIEKKMEQLAKTVEELKILKMENSSKERSGSQCIIL